MEKDYITYKGKIISKEKILKTRKKFFGVKYTIMHRLIDILKSIEKIEDEILYINIFIDTYTQDLNKLENRDIEKKYNKINFSLKEILEDISILVEKFDNINKNDTYINKQPPTAPFINIQENYEKNFHKDISNISNKDIFNKDISNISNKDIFNKDISNKDISNISNKDIFNKDISNISNKDISNMKNYHHDNIKNNNIYPNLFNYQQQIPSAIPIIIH